MHFEEGHVYHVYNQGNNRQKLFFSRKNYLFFTKKIRTHILPHADILAWCLMPNHFHLMLYVHTLDITSRVTHQTTPSHQLSKNALSNSIGVLLRSYTRAINIQQDTSGSLFRQKTKSINLTQTNKLTPAYFNTEFGTKINISLPKQHYINICFNYIHENPVKARLVMRSEDWEFSSAQDYAGLRNGTLVNKERAGEIGLLVQSTLAYSNDGKLSEEYTSNE